jgi:hypothetical protein
MKANITSNINRESTIRILDFVRDSVENQTL